jgi:type II secretory ATPase GspE/PulE/Tfp pilus assembly ATPase PilB-like protein
MAVNTHERLGEILVSTGVITPDQLEHALSVRKRSHKRLGEILVSLGLVSEQDIVEALSSQLGIPSVDLSKARPSPEVLALMPADFARRHCVLPLEKLCDRVVLAMANPLDVLALDYVRARTGFQVEPRVASRSEAMRAISHYYVSSDEALTDAREQGLDLERLHLDEVSLDSADASAVEKITDQGAVVEVVNTLVLQAINSRATDLHLEPMLSGVRVRLRIDGVMREARTLPRSAQLPMISRIKIMAGMDITERRLPQDGRIKAEFDGRALDLRVATLPTLYGESVNIRILQRSGTLITLDDLGFLPDTQEQFRTALRHSHGIILLTGPTGSGKTTTLYALLRAINDGERKIITVEDPIEYELDGVSQSQINPRAGVTFAAQLRAILRHDPDVILVGEIRDLETAEIAMRAALTGHLVFSTLHTNDAASALTRLVDMGVQPYIVAASMIAAAAQRLARQNCPRCAEPYEPSLEILTWVSLDGEEARDHTFLKGKGCSFCGGLGYRGRLAVCEFLEVTEPMRAAITKARGGDPALLRQQGMRTLLDDGLEKVKMGLTTPEELVRAGVVART